MPTCARTEKCDGRKGQDKTAGMYTDKAEFLLQEQDRLHESLGD